MNDLPVPLDAIPALSVGPFMATPTGLLPTKQDVAYEIWEAYGRGLQRVQRAIHWVVGDWLNYGERAYGEKYAQALEATSFEYQTLNRDRWVAQQIEFNRRRLNLSHAHHIEVAALDADEQDHWLELALIGIDGKSWTRSELRAAIREGRRRRQLVPTFPEGKFSVLYADPPWAYQHQWQEQAAAGQYRTLHWTEVRDYEDPEGRQICDLCVPETVLFLWVTSPHLDHGLAVVKAWGFEYKASMVWDKGRAPGMGWWMKTHHEFLLIGARKQSRPPDVKPISVICYEPSRHSAKPEELYGIIEAMYRGPYCELFGRGEPREGWEIWGDEIARQD